MSTLEYKGYTARVEFDSEADLLHGEVINTRDVITFQGTSVQEVKQAFHAAIEDYLEFCASRNEEPEKPYSGRFALRMDPELHRKIASCAVTQHVSLNSWIVERLESAVLGPIEPPQAWERYTASLLRFYVDRMRVVREPELTALSVHAVDDYWSKSIDFVVETKHTGLTPRSRLFGGTSLLIQGGSHAS